MKVLITDIAFDDIEPERRLLEPMGAELTMASSTDPGTLAAEAGDADAILVCFAPLPASVVDAAGAGGCRVISRYGIGYDNVDVEAATANGIVVTNVPDYCLDEVADHTMALLLDHARAITVSAASVSAGEWDFDRARIGRIAGKRLALIGFGGIGRRVAERAVAFGLDVHAFDPYVEDAGEAGVTMDDDLAGMVSQADFVSVHAPLTADNHHLVDADLISKMKDSALLINTARGGLVDLEVATLALQRGEIGGLALDVTEPEPLPEDHPLRVHERAVITPHAAFHSVEATEELQTRAAREVAHALSGEPNENPVNEVTARTS
jgi:D-3-phosphoglycerate dehydrogenase